MSNLLSYIQSHPAASTFAAVWIFSNLVTALPTPKPTDSRWYQFLFTALHGLVGGLPRILVAANPQLAASLGMVRSSVEASPATTTNEDVDAKRPGNPARP